MEQTTNHRGTIRWLTIPAVLLGMLAAAATSALAQESAQGDVSDTPDAVYALTTEDQLLFFNGNNPRGATSEPVTGLQEGESLVGIDFRPADEQLYGVGDQSNIYTINEETAQATLVSTLEDANSNVVQLEGRYFGVDFNPNTDRLRIVSDTGQNLGVDDVDDTALTTVEGDLFYADGDPNEGEDPGVTAAAYTNDLDVRSDTDLYDIDTGLDLLDHQEPVTGGRLSTVGSLGVNAKGISGFDIVTTISNQTLVNRAYAALLLKGKPASFFYGVDLETGQLTKIGRIGGKTTKVEGLAIPIGQK